MQPKKNRPLQGSAVAAVCSKARAQSSARRCLRTGLWMHQSLALWSGTVCCHGLHMEGAIKTTEVCGADSLLFQLHWLLHVCTVGVWLCTWGGYPGSRPAVHLGLAVVSKSASREPPRGWGGVPQQSGKNKSPNTNSIARSPDGAQGRPIGRIKGEPAPNQRQQSAAGGAQADSS